MSEHLKKKKKASKITLHEIKGLENKLKKLYFP